MGVLMIWKLTYVNSMLGSVTLSPSHWINVDLSKDAQQPRLIFEEYDSSYSISRHGKVFWLGATQSYLVCTVLIQLPEAYIKWTLHFVSWHQQCVHCSYGSLPFTISVGIYKALFSMPWMNNKASIGNNDCQSPLMPPWSLLYFNNPFLASECHIELHFQVEHWEDVPETNRMRLNIQMTKYMECEPEMNGTIITNDGDFRKSTKFRYYYFIISSNTINLHKSVVYIIW